MTTPLDARPIATDVARAWSVCPSDRLSVGLDRQPCAKTAEPIDVPLGGGMDSCGPEGPCVR